MQPIQIGMNAAVVLVALLLAVPLQLFVSHYINKSYEEGGDSGPSGIMEVRAAAMHQLIESTHSIVGKFHSTMRYYSTWGHLKELVMVPFKKRDKMAALQMKTTVFKSGGGVTTILIEPSDSKSSKRKQKSGSQGESKVKHTAAKVTEGGQPSDSRGASASSSETEARSSTRQVEDEGTSPAREVEDYLMKEVYFGQSGETRDVKPPNVKYSVGQVIKHRQEGYYGVIIGWDEAIKAPESWITRHYSRRNVEQLAQSAHYLVLVDSHFDASGSPYRYLPQEDVEVITNVQIQCPELSRYFEGYKHGRHIPKPWLQNRYPRD